MDAPYYNAGPDERDSDRRERRREDVFVACRTGCGTLVHLEHFDRDDPPPMCDACYDKALAQMRRR